MSAPTKQRYGWDHPAPPSWPQFAGWFVVGPVLIAGLLAAFTPLIVITIPVTMGLTLIISSRTGFNASLFGALSGVGLGPLLIGVVNFHESDFSPWPWLAASVVFLAGGIAGYLTVIKSDLRSHPTVTRS